jgi:hypothetical protein
MRRRKEPKSDLGEISIAASGPTLANGHEVSFFYTAPWFRGHPNRWQELGDMFLCLCQQMDAFVGTLFHMTTSRKRLPRFDAELWDVAWLNYFGPGYLEYWGPRLDGLGFKSKPVGHGRAIWASESPFEVSLAAKEPFYEALGRDTFAVTKTREAEPGELVPDYEAHKRHAPGGERWIRGFPRPCNQYQAATAFRLIDGMPICKNCGYTEPEHQAPRSMSAR